MGAAAEIGRNPVSKHQVQPEYGEWAGWRGTGLPNPSRETKFSGANGGTGKVHFPCSADHKQDWQPYPVDPYSDAMCDDHTYKHTVITLSADGPQLDRSLPLGYLFAFSPILVFCVYGFYIAMQVQRSLQYRTTSPCAA